MLNIRADRTTERSNNQLQDFDGDGPVDSHCKEDNRSNTAASRLLLDPPLRE
jgi:hypothetical protein